MLKYLMIEVLFYVSIACLIVTLFSVGLGFAVCKGNYLQDYLIRDYVFYVLGIFVVGLVLPICLFKLTKPDRVKGFKKVKDLIRGTITTNIQEMH